MLARCMTELERSKQRIKLVLIDPNELSSNVVDDYKGDEIVNKKIVPFKF